MRGFERFPGQDQKYHTLQPPAGHSERDWREQDWGREGEAQPWDLGTVPLSAVDPYVALDDAFAVTV